MKERSILIHGSILFSCALFLLLLRAAAPTGRQADDLSMVAPAESGQPAGEFQAGLAPPVPMPPRLVRTLALNPDGYDPVKTSFAAELLLGDLLFHSPQTLGPKAQALGISCHTCHPNGATHSHFSLAGVSDRPGNVDLSTAHFRADVDNGVADMVNIPSLRGVRYTGPYGRDGRTSSLAEFVNGVVFSEFGGRPLSPAKLGALVRYVQELDFLPNRNVDSTGGLTVQAGGAARAGERHFRKPRAGLGGESCASCHVPSSFFRDGKTHRHGSGYTASPFSMDDGYETPTLLNAVETAPYFHDGRFATFGEVLAWYDKTYRLRLTARERSELAAYLKAVGTGEPPEDDRPVGRRLLESFSYLVLLVKGEAKDDGAVWEASLDLVRRELEALREFSEISAGVQTMDERLKSLEERHAAGEPRSSLRGEVEKIHQELTRSASDWAGVLATPRQQTSK